MATPQRWYVVCCVQPWSSLEVMASFGAWKHSAAMQEPDHELGQPVGYLAVFNTREEAVQWREGTQVLEIIAAPAEARPGAAEGGTS